MLRVALCVFGWFLDNLALTHNTKEEPQSKQADGITMFVHKAQTHTDPDAAHSQCAYISLQHQSKYKHGYSTVVQ